MEQARLVNSLTASLAVIAGVLSVALFASWRWPKPVQAQVPEVAAGR